MDEEPNESGLRKVVGRGRDEGALQDSDESWMMNVRTGQDGETEARMVLPPLSGAAPPRPP